MADSQDLEAEGVVALAAILGVALREEHVPEVARAWRMMAPHRALVAAETLDPCAEPAALFRP
jgi:hypothetical protein